MEVFAAKVVSMHDVSNLGVRITVHSSPAKSGTALPPPPLSSGLKGTGTPCALHGGLVSSNSDRFWLMLCLCCLVFCASLDVNRGSRCGCGCNACACSLHSLLMHGHSENGQSQGVEYARLDVSIRLVRCTSGFCTYNSTALNPAAVPASATPAWYLLVLLLTMVLFARPRSSGRKGASQNP